MEFLIFTFTIAVILEDYGTLQTKSIADCTSNEQVDMFKNYALNLVLAAIPPLRNKHALTEGACECISATDNNLTIMDIILETTCMAKNYETDLEYIRDNETLDSDDFKLAMRDELRGNIRRILLALETSHTDRKLSFMDDVEKKYILKYKRDNAEMGDEDKKLAMKCHQAITTLDYENNDKYFLPLYHGFEVASALLRDDFENPRNTPLKGKLDSIIGEISTAELRIPDDDYTKQSFEKAVKKLDDSDSDWDPEYFARGA